jgi:hypothetical protein
VPKSAEPIFSQLLLAVFPRGRARPRHGDGQAPRSPVFSPGHSPTLGEVPSAAPFRKRPGVATPAKFEGMMTGLLSFRLTAQLARRITSCVPRVWNDEMRVSFYRSRKTGERGAFPIPGGGETAAEVLALRRCTHTGRPLGGVEFVQALEQTTQRCLPPPPRRTETPRAAPLRFCGSSDGTWTKKPV